VTSRNPAWTGVADPVPVDTLSLNEAAQLLTRRSGDSNHEGAVALAAALGRLPLALEQAASYADSVGLSLAAYLEVFDRRRDELLRLGTPLAYQGTVDATFSLTIDQLRKHAPAALQLLELCALLAPDKLPIILLLSQPDQLPDPLATAARDLLQQHAVPAALLQAGLLTKDTDKTVRIHRLIQAVTMHRLPDSDLQRRLTEATELLAALFPIYSNEPERWPEAAVLLPHVQAVLDHARTHDLVNRAVGDLLTRAGLYIAARGLGLALARALREQALDVLRKLDEAENDDLAAGMSYLASTLHSLGEFERARDLNEQALAMFQRLHHGDHSNVASSLSNFAIDLSSLDEHERARDLNEQALAMRQRLYQGDHPDIAISLNNLAIELRAVDEHERARDLDEQALAMRQRLYQGDHPFIARSLGNLAIDLSSLGEHERARDLNEQALAMRQRLYQGDHPDMAMSLDNLAIELSSLGEHERARDLNEQALAMRQRLYQGDHPDIAISLNNLAIELRVVDEHERARDLDEQALAMRQRIRERS
jgi:tetratricopeptide (TPR) repeat protein